MFPQLVSDCQPENGFYGFHMFGNIEELLPLLDRRNKKRQVCDIFLSDLCVLIKDQEHYSLLYKDFLDRRSSVKPEKMTLIMSSGLSQLGLGDIYRVVLSVSLSRLRTMKLATLTQKLTQLLQTSPHM